MPEANKPGYGRMLNLYRLGDVMALQNRKHNARLERTKIWLYRPLITSDDQVCLAARWELWANNNRKWSWKVLDRRKRTG